MRVVSVFVVVVVIPVVMCVKYQSRNHCFEFVNEEEGQKGRGSKGRKKGKKTNGICRSVRI